MKKPYAVGRTDCKPIPGKKYTIRRFATEEEAVDFIERIKKHWDPQGVDKGEYYLDAPEK